MLSLNLISRSQKTFLVLIKRSQKTVNNSKRLTSLTKDELTQHIKCVWNGALLWPVAAAPGGSVYQEESSVRGNDEGKRGSVYQSPSKSARSYIHSLQRREDGTNTPVFLLESLNLYLLPLKHFDRLRVLRSCTWRQAENQAALVS